MGRSSHRWALGLGGNIGEVPATMRAALRRIGANPNCTVEAVSSLYRTPPWGRTDQPAFLNACAIVGSTLAPRAMLALCLDTERALKRDRSQSERWGPRPIDLDLLVCEGLKLDEPDLTVPHPRMTERGFVLMPLAEIAPDMVVAGKPVREWLFSAETDGIERVEDQTWLNR